MDGQRRVTRPMKQKSKLRPDCSKSYRAAVRLLSVGFLGVALLHGIVSGGHLNYAGSPYQKLPGKIAGMFGLAALDIRLSGLKHHEANDVLAKIGVRPGGALFGFDAKKARASLQELDWIDSATVMRSFPNQLQIEVVEREPFVVWQHNGLLQVVDQNGKPMSGISPSATNLLMHVIGEGANTAASELVNQMEATPVLFHEVKAATRVGSRRWNLVMKNGLKIALPEHDAAVALQTAQAAVVSEIARSGKVQMIDLRIAGEVAYHASTLPASDPSMTSSIQ